MVEIEILFSSGQGIVLPLEDKEAALKFMKRAMDTDFENVVGLTHFSNEYEEVLIDLADISFIRLKKENYPRLEEGTTLKLAAHSTGNRQAKYRHANPEEPIEMGTTHSDAEPISMGSHKEAEASKKNNKAQQASKAAEQQPEDPLDSQMKRAKQQFDKAENRLDEIEHHRQNVEAKLKEQQEALDDEKKEHQLRKEFENIEISNEIKDLKNKGQ